MNPFRLAIILSLSIMVAACGGIQSKVIANNGSAANAKALELAPIQVSSREQTADAQNYNREWEKLAQEELQGMMQDKGITNSTNGEGSIECKIKIVYGNKALRYFVGYGAGSGSVEVTLALRDNAGNVQYATTTNSKLAMGAWGGDMKATAQKTIQAAIDDFSQRL